MTKIERFQIVNDQQHKTPTQKITYAKSKKKKSIKVTIPNLRPESGRWKGDRSSGWSQKYACKKKTAANVECSKDGTILTRVQESETNKSNHNTSQQWRDVNS